MALVQQYNDDGDARLFEESGLVITIARADRKLTRKDVAPALRMFGYKQGTKWVKLDWGWEARFYRIAR